MAVYSQDIQEKANTFYVIKLFGTYMAYEPCFGNVIKIYGQNAYGSLNRVSPLVKYMRVERKKDKIKIFYVEKDIESGLKVSPVPKIIHGRPGTTTEYKEGYANFIGSSTKPKYDYLIREQSIYYCIETSSGDYLLYDYDMGNPLKGDIQDKMGNTYIVQSGNEKNTQTLIQSLPPKATVYSLKVDSKFGFVKGNPLFEKYSTDDAKKQLETISHQKNSNGTKMKIRKEEKRIEKRDSLIGNR